MSQEQLNAVADITSSMYALFICILVAMIAFSVILCSVSWARGYKAGRRDARNGHRSTPAHLKPYRTPNTLPSKAMPNVKQPTAYTISRTYTTNRRNNAYQVRYR